MTPLSGLEACTNVPTSGLQGDVDPSLRDHRDTRGMRVDEEAASGWCPDIPGKNYCNIDNGVQTLNSPLPR